MASADLTVIALGRPEASSGAYIAEAQRPLARQDELGYLMHPTGTSSKVESVRRLLDADTDAPDTPR